MINLENLESLEFAKDTYNVLGVCDSKDAHRLYKVGSYDLGSKYPNKRLVCVTKHGSDEGPTWFFESDMDVCTNFKYKTRVITKSTNRLDLISDTIEQEKEMANQTLQIQDNTFFVEPETNIAQEIRQLKDQLFLKVKSKAQQEQAKKDMASSYRETIGVLKEEIEDILVKITSLQDQEKINNLIK